MPYYEVTITRCESFTIEAKTPDEAVDLAFDGYDKGNAAFLEHDETTLDHTVEEKERPQMERPL